MTVGYPDYTRVTRAGGYLLYGVVNLTPPYNSPLFSGYVGNWPYLTVALNVNSTTDFVKVIIAYYSDNTFTNLIGFRYLIRAGANFSVTQYANLTEWCRVWYLTQSGNPVNFLGFSVYATSDPATTNQLVSGDVPAFNFIGSVAANTIFSDLAGHVQPGPGIIQIFSSATAWTVQIQYYDFGTAAYETIAYWDETVNAHVVEADVGLIDAPLQVVMTNNDAAARTFRVSIVST